MPAWQVQPREVRWLSSDARGRAASWSEHRTDDGNTYWYNSETKESTWENPFVSASASESPPSVITKIYSGAFADAVKYIKYISITSCGMTSLAAPLLFLASDESLGLTTRLLISAGEGVPLASEQRIHFIHSFTQSLTHSFIQ